MFIQIPYLMKSDMETKEIIGRDKEKEKLQKAFFSKESEFIAVYGRRRIGKTFLIRHFFSKQKGVFHGSTFMNFLLLDETFLFKIIPVVKLLIRNRQFNLDLDRPGSSILVTSKRFQQSSR